MAKPLRILLLEDSEDDALLIVNELRQAGFDPEVERVETEADFITHLDRAPTLILADYRLPQFDALRALHLVREGNVDVPVIVITGALSDETAGELLGEGARDYLLKDRLARLGLAVTQALEQQKSREDERRAVQALRDSESRKTAILETAVDGIVSFDDQGIVEACNPAADRLFGSSPGELIGQNFRAMFDISGPNARDRFPDCFLANTNNSSGGGREVVGRSKNGSAIPMELTASDVQLVDRRIFTVIVRDITERKRIELELARQSRELARSNLELEQFAYLASHDLHEPLRTIGSFTELMAKRYRGQLDATADEFILYITDGVAHMKTLIDDLLAYSRVAPPGAVHHPVDCEAIVERTIENLKLTIDESDAVVTHDSLPTIRANQTQISQLFQNLIDNAIKYHGETCPRVHIAALLRGDEWVFSIRDNGIGFDPSDAERIFTMFQRLHSKDRFPGTGIGLAACKKIVERHSGRIWAESEPGRGSCFFFTVPRTAD